MRYDTNGDLIHDIDLNGIPPSRRRNRIADFFTDNPALLMWGIVLPVLAGLVVVLHFLGIDIPASDQ